MIISKLTTKARTTIPQPIRTVLHLNPGDAIAYIIEDDRVVMLKAPGQSARGPIDDPSAAFDEWSNEDDEHASADI